MYRQKRSNFIVGFSYMNVDYLSNGQQGNLGTLSIMIIKVVVLHGQCPKETIGCFTTITNALLIVCIKQ